MKKTALALVGVIALVASVLLAFNATAALTAAEPVPACVKPSGDPTHQQQVDYAECLQKRTEAMLTNLHPVPTATETVTTTETVTVTPTPTPIPTPTPTPTPSGDNPAPICGSTLLDGPTTALAGATVVPAGDNSDIWFGNPGVTYWFAPGVHTLGGGEFDQISPGDGATFVGAPGAVLDGQGINRYAFTDHGANVTIRYLTIRGFTAPAQEGVVNHDGGDGWLMEYLTVANNKGAGVMFGRDNTLRHSCVRSNGVYGWNSIGGERNIVMHHNEIADNNTDDTEAKNPGCGCSGGGKFWDATNVQVTDNWIHSNNGAGIWADTNDVNFTVTGNLIENNSGQAMFYEAAYNAVISNNVIRRNTIELGREFAARGDNFPVGTLYISEAGHDARLPHTADSLLISNNVFEDNWGGVVLWENADRFCGSAANTSTGYCTLTNPSVVNLDTCDAGTFGANGSLKPEPYYTDCRWSTKNVHVTGNQFRLNPANIPGCTVGFCGLQAVLSNVGTFPSWSPYTGRVIQEAITFHNNNRWSDNTYVGPWRFNPYEPGRTLTFAQWQAAPYNQDAGSTLN